MIRSRILAAGGYLPSDLVTNEALAQRYNLDTSDEWIVERSGIRQRHIAAPGETTSAMGAAAAREAMARAGILPADVDAVIVATATPDSSFPATAGHHPGFRLRYPRRLHRLRLCAERGR